MTLFLNVTQSLIKVNRKKNSSLVLPLELGGTSLLLSLTVSIVIITKTHCHLKKSPEYPTSQRAGNALVGKGSMSCDWPLLPCINTQNDKGKEED